VRRDRQAEVAARDEDAAVEDRPLGPINRPQSTHWQRRHVYHRGIQAVNGARRAGVETQTTGPPARRS